MKKILALLFVLIVALGALTACKDKNEPEDNTFSYSSDWEVVPENTNPNLKYFGYYHADGWQTWGTDNYFDEIDRLNNANVMPINTFIGIDKTIEVVKTVKDMGYKSIVSVANLFYSSHTGALDDVDLKAGYDTSWAEFSKKIEPYLDSVLAFYFDEPYWLSVKKTAFHTATSLIRETFPEARVMACTSAMEFGASTWGNIKQVDSDYYKYCTDLGYDRYRIPWSDTERAEFLQLFKERVATNNQWLWAIPQAFDEDPFVTKGKEIYNYIKGFYTEAINEPRYVGILAYTFASDPESDWGYGLEDFFDFNDEEGLFDEDLLDLYVEIGQKITGKTGGVQLPDTAAPEITVENESVLDKAYPYNYTLTLPAASAVDAEDGATDVTVEVLDAENNALPVSENKVTFGESGTYTVKYSSEDKAGNAAEKTYTVVIKAEGEISSFENAFYKDAVLSEEDLKCWPNEVSGEVTHDGSAGALKVTPDATNGTWPAIRFSDGASEKFDMTGYDYLSMYLYNAGTEDLTGFGLRFSDSSAKVTYTFTVPAGKWYEVRITKAEIEEMEKNTTVDGQPFSVESMLIKLVQTAGTYDNRCVFYVDDVRFGKYTAAENSGDSIMLYDFETEGQAESLNAKTSTVDGKLSFDFTAGSPVNITLASVFFKGNRANEPKVLEEKDLSKYYLVFDVASDTEKTIKVGFNMKNSAGTHKDNAVAAKYVKADTIKIDLAETVYGTDVGKLIIYISSNGNPETVSVTVDNIRLELK